MLRVGIIGCGKISDAHAEQIQRLPGCEIVGVCDEEELMARQLHERFKVGAYFSDVKKLLADSLPDVVHITTPPQSHFPLGKLCLESGCHAYIEKPFTLNTREAEELLQLADRKDLKMTVGHDHQFTHAALRMRKLIQEGYLGGAPLHMESIYGYDLGDPVYARALLGDAEHWVRRLPGKLLQNIISHGIAKIAEFVACDAPKVIAHGFTSPFLREIGECEIVDELRVTISDGMNTTAYFTFSSQMRPCLHQFRIFGPRNGLIVDHDEQTVIKLPGGKYKSHLQRFVPPFLSARQYVGNSVSNVGRFLRNDFHMDWGLKCLISSFYESIVEKKPPPIPYREIILTSKIMDDIFTQLRAGGN